MHLLNYKFNEKNKKMTIHLESEIFNRPLETQMHLLGKMQAQNAAQAAITVKKIFPNLDEEIIEREVPPSKPPASSV